MKTKLTLKTVIIIAAAIFLSSCVVDEYINRSWSFDEKTFNDVSSYWAKQDLKDYSFRYSISTYMPDGIIGDVTVDNGIGCSEISFNGESITKDDYNIYADEVRHYEENYFKTDKIWFKTIDDAFLLIAERVALYRTHYNKDGSDIISYEMKVEYNETYHYPKYISEHVSSKNDEHTDRNGDWDGGLCVRITDFRTK